MLFLILETMIISTVRYTQGINSKKFQDKLTITKVDL